MKNIAIIFAAVVLMIDYTTSSAQTVHKNDNWYTGAKLGWSKYYDTGFHYDTSFHNDDFTDHTNNIFIHNNQLSTSVFFGYQLNQHLCFELGYNKVGNIRYKNNIDSSVFKLQGIPMTAKLSYPLTKDLDIYTRLGSMLWRADYRGLHTTNDSTNYINDHDTGVSPLVAAGLEYTWTKNWSTNLDYQLVSDIGNVNTVINRPDNAMLSVGMSYHFKNDHTVRTTYIPTSSIKPKRFILKSDVLFDFDKAQLKSKSQQVLDHLYEKLSSINPEKKYSIVILGYTDRIGSSIYNQKLSQARAQNVANYLIHKGIPSDKILIHGMGQYNPVTNNTCEILKFRAATINCLAPDRRVSIEVKSITNEVM